MTTVSLGFGAQTLTFGSFSQKNPNNKQSFRHILIICLTALAVMPFMLVWQ